MNEYNLDDLNLIIEKSASRIKSTPDYSLTYISPLEPHLLENTIKLACSNFGIEVSKDFIRTLRIEVGRQPFDLVFIKNGENEFTKLSNSDTVKLLNPVIYHLLKNDSPPPSLDKLVKINKTHAISEEQTFPNLNAISLANYKNIEIGLEDVKTTCQALRKTDKSLDFDYSEKRKQLAVYHYYTDEECKALADSRDWTKLKQTAFDAQYTKLSKLSSRLYNKHEIKTP